MKLNYKISKSKLNLQAKPELNHSIYYKGL